MAPAVAVNETLLEPGTEAEGGEKVTPPPDGAVTCTGPADAGLMSTLNEIVALPFGGRINELALVNCKVRLKTVTPNAGPGKVLPVTETVVCTS